jgi:hypothetical protein
MRKGFCDAFLARCPVVQQDESRIRHRETLLPDPGGIFPMLTYIRTIVVLTIASLWINHSRATGLNITIEDWSTVAPEARSGEQADSPNGSASVANVIDFANETDEARRESVDALKSYRKLAESNPETYLPGVAATLNGLGIIDGDQNRMGIARKEFEEALEIYRKLAQQEAPVYLPYVATTLNNLGILEGNPRRLEEALAICRDLGKKDRPRYLPYLAITLNNLGVRYSDNNRVLEARDRRGMVKKGSEYEWN